MRATAWAAALGLLAGCGADVPWTTLAPSGEGFRVEMPGPPRLVERQVSLAFGAAAVRMWVVEDGDRAFIAGYTAYPPRIERVASEDELLDGARDRAARNAEGRLVRDEPHELRGHRGRAVEIDAKQGRVAVRGRFYVAGARLYQVLATTTPEEARSERVERFLASFDLAAEAP